MHSLLRQLMKKKKTIPESMYILASQFAWYGYPSAGSEACQSFELLQAAAVNNDLLLSELAWLSKG